MRTLAIMMFVALVASAMGLSSATAKPPELKEEDDKFVLDNGHVAVWFQGKKPMLKVMPHDVAASLESDLVEVGASLDLGNASGAYEYKFTDVVEYRDLDANGAPSNNEVVARLQLDKASGWEVEQVITEERIVLNLSLEAPVKLGKGLPVDDIAVPDVANRTARIALTFFIHDEAVELDAGGVNVSVPETSIKYDFLVEQWPFVDAANNRLALETLVTGALEVDEGDAVQGAQVASNGTELGALSWVTTATGTTAAGESIEVPVRTHVAAEGEMSRVTYTYDAAGFSTLLHDPTIGTTSTASEAEESSGSGPLGAASKVPFGGALLVAAGLGVAAIALRRRS